MGRQLAAQLAEHFGDDRPLRVLDVGCGQGTQALRLARAGHAVTGIDPDPVTLAAARAAVAVEPPQVQSRITLHAGDGADCGRWFGPGSFDAVLCHGVLMYLEDPEPLLASLARVLGPGGLLSVLCRNADALAMRPALTGDWTAALAAFDGVHYTNRLGLPTRADRLADLARTLTELQVPLRSWFGVRVFCDTVPDDAPLPPDLPELLAVEERAGAADPYRGVAALLHVIGVKA
ncbi:class I SAM-dependent methyltransferase [Streptacidiphilus monticola]|uniref:Class I SAM-dependent methyltransferase n=1 Tax=Streptacidiphilus monticola TaxID=2161674 RepID=A0ABW1FYH8_9ACTN